MKRALLLIFTMVVVANATAFGQEKEPLVMQVEFEWTVVGIMAGAILGALFWLTDPADPDNTLSDSLASGAAWGAILGAGFGAFVLQDTAVSPQTAAMRNNPLLPLNRVTGDPVAVENGESTLFAGGGPPQPGQRRIVLPIFKMRF